MTNKVTFDSSNFPEGETVTLACGYISLNRIVFINEDINVDIEAKTGQIEFYDAEDKQLLSIKAELPQAGDEKFSEVKCVVEGDKIKLGFPRYTYKDNYPNCDGESDRWTKIISGFNFLCYDFKNNRMVEQ